MQVLWQWTHSPHSCLYTCSLYSCATYLLNFIISPSVILGQISSSAQLSPVVRCYAPLSHTWLDSPLVLYISTPNTSVLSPLLLRLSLCHLFLPIFTSQSPAVCLHAASSHARPLSPLSLWQSPPPSPPLCSSLGSSGSTACRKLRALDLTVCLVSPFDKNHSKLCAHTNSFGLLHFV